VIHKTYELVCPLSAHAALERIEALLSKESVQYRAAADLSVTSTQTPILLWVEPWGWRPSNWVGVNPFRYVSGVDVRCESGGDGFTRVIVRVNRFRAFFFGGFSFIWCLLLACAVPEPWAKSFPIAFGCVAWFGIVSFLGDYLIKKEIGDHLKVAPYQGRWYILGVRAGSWLLSWRKSRRKAD
jgi:hypothetical protein